MSRSMLKRSRRALLVDETMQPRVQGQGRRWQYAADGREGRRASWATACGPLVGGSPWRLRSWRLPSSASMLRPAGLPAPCRDADVEVAIDGVGVALSEDMLVEDERLLRPTNRRDEEVSRCREQDARFGHVRRWEVNVEPARRGHERQVGARSSRITGDSMSSSACRGLPDL